MSDIESQIVALVAAATKRDGTKLLTLADARATILRQREFDTELCATPFAPAVHRAHQDGRSL